MAKVTIYPGKEFLRRIEQMQGNIDQAIPTALEEGGKIVLSTMHGKLASVIGRNTKHPSKSTGKLLSALGLSPVKTNDSGNSDVKVGFAEGRPGKSNAMLANILEYGKSGQSPKPFLAPTKSKAKQPCLDAMEAAIKRELGIK